MYFYFCSKFSERLFDHDVLFVVSIKNNLTLSGLIFVFLARKNFYHLKVIK